jgi:hypothetical protein
MLLCLKRQAQDSNNVMLFASFSFVNIFLLMNTDTSFTKYMREFGRDHFVYTMGLQCCDVLKSGSEG